MPFINGRFYMNPAYGRALERARAAENERLTALQPDAPQEQDEDGHWVTIGHRHVLIHESQGGRARSHLSARDKAYLDKYYDAVAALAKKYNVDPALVLGLGVESSFATQGTYLKTGDAFGMTGGSTKHMITAASPAEDVQKFFDQWGNQIRGTGSDADAFIKGLEGRDPMGDPVPGWKVYNTANPDWGKIVGSGIAQMHRDVPIYTAQRGTRGGVR